MADRPGRGHRWVVSTVDPHSRHVHTSIAQHHDGFKAHLAVEPGTGLILANTVTAGNVNRGSAVS